MRRKGQNTKFLQDCIAQALTELMRQKPYAQITVSEICARAGVGRTTYYRHFPEEGGRDDVLIYRAYSLWAAYADAHAEQVQADGGAALLNYIYDNRDFYTLLRENKLDNVLFAVFYRAIGPKPEDSPEMAAVKAFLAGGVFGITYQWIDSGFQKTPDELSKGIDALQAAQAKEHGEFR